MDKKNIVKKTIQIGLVTLVSRFLGLTREILFGRYIGVGMVADAFNTAFMIPNSLRKVFAEGALTSALVPTYITMMKKETKEQANGLISLFFVVFESLLLVCCAFVMWKAYATIALIMPGFSHEQIEITVPLLHILMPFIFFMSISALLSGPLQSMHHFFIPSMSPVVLNIAFLIALLCFKWFHYSVDFICYIVLLSGAFQCLMHVVMYVRLGLGFSFPDAVSIRYFYQAFGKFLMGFFSASVMEIGLFLDQAFASYLSVGSVTIMKYASRFMGIPLGVFGVAFSTILLPSFTKTKLEDPDKLHFYIFEALKLILWVTIPATLFLAFFSQDIFITFFTGGDSKFPLARVAEASQILICFLIGLCFFSLNKIFFSVFFAMHDMKAPTIISIIGVGINYGANCYLIDLYGGSGIAFATTISGFVQTVLCFYFLHTYHGLTLSIKKLAQFFVRFVVQTMVVLGVLWVAYRHFYVMIASSSYYYFFTKSFGFWLWVTPLMIVGYIALYYSRIFFKIDLYFFE